MDKDDKDFRKLIDTLSGQNKTNLALQALLVKYNREVAGEDGDKREDQLEKIADLLERIEQAITGIKVDFDLTPAVGLLEDQTRLLKSISEEQVLLRKIGEGSLEYDKKMGSYRNTSGREVTNIVTGKVTPKGGVVDFETARSPLAGQSKAVIERVTNNQSNSTQQVTSAATPVNEIPVIRPLPENTRAPGDKSNLDKSIQALISTLKVTPKKFGDELAKRLSDFKVPESEKTATEKLKEVVSIYKEIGGALLKGPKALGKGIATVAKAGKSLITEPAEFKKQIGAGKESIIEKAKKAKDYVSDIISVEPGYTVEKERFSKELTKQQLSKVENNNKSEKELTIEGEKKYEQITSKEKEIASVEKTIKQAKAMGLSPAAEDVKKLDKLKQELAETKVNKSVIQPGVDSRPIAGTEPKPVTSVEPKVGVESQARKLLRAESQAQKKDINVSEEDDNVVSAQEQIADSAKADLEISKEALNIQKEQLSILKQIRDAIQPKIPSELPTTAPTKSGASGEQESSVEEKGPGIDLDLGIGRRALRALGRGAKALGRGVKALGKGALSLGGKIARFAGSPAGRLGGAALAIGAGGYTAYKGYNEAEETRQQEIQAIEEKEKAGEIAPEKAVELKKEVEAKATENKGGAVGKGTGLAAGAIGGGIAGAKVGATIGTFLGGPVGTAVGAGIGTIAGGAIGAISGSSVGQNIGGFIGKGVAKVKNFFGKDEVGDKAKAAVSGQSSQAIQKDETLSTKFSESTFAKNDIESYKKFVEFREQRKKEIYNEEIKKRKLNADTAPAQILQSLKQESESRAKTEAVKKFQKEIEAAGASSSIQEKTGKGTPAVERAGPTSQPTQTEGNLKGFVPDKKQLDSLVQEKLKQYPESLRSDPSIIQDAREEATMEMKASALERAPTATQPAVQPKTDSKGFFSSIGDSIKNFFTSNKSSSNTTQTTNVSSGERTAAKPMETAAGKADRLLAKASALRSQATKLGIDPNNAKGVYEGGVLTKIIDSTSGEEHEVEVSEQDRKNVEAARSIRSLNERSRNLVAARQPSMGAAVAKESTENADLTRSVTGTSAPVLPPIISSSVNNVNSTSFVPIKPSVRPDHSGSALDRYNARVSHY